MTNVGYLVSSPKFLILAIAGALLVALVLVINGFANPGQTFAAGGPAGLVAHYTFDGQDGTDSSGNGNHGTLAGSPTFAAGPSGFGDAMVADLGKYVVLPDTTALSLRDHDFTVTAWVNASAFSGLGGYGGDWAVLGNRGPGGGGSTGLHLVMRDGRPYMGFFGNDLGSGNNLSLNTWYHIGWRYTKATGEMTLFLDGNQIASGGGHAPFIGIGDTFIGRCCETWDSPRYAKGLIDDVQIYDRPLTEGEVASLMNAAPPEPPEGPSGQVVILSSADIGPYAGSVASSFEAAGKTVVYKTPSEWAAMTTADFASYDAIALPDPNCTFNTGPIAAAIANASVWGAAVDGNIIIFGADEQFNHRAGAPNPEGQPFSDSMAPFVVADVGKTGAFVSLSCYYHGKGTGTAIPVLDAFSVGGVTVVHPPGCFNNGHIVETDHPAMNDLTDEVMNSGALWTCSAHNAFNTWPSDFQVLANALGVGSYVESDGSIGLPYILARGASSGPPEPTDTTPPVITSTVTGTLGDNGWYVSPVTVSYTASDTGSGIDEDASDLGDDDLLSDRDGQSASGTAVDNAGNSATATASDIDIDQTDPDVTTPADQVVSSGDPAGAVVNFSPTGSDATSGIASVTSNPASGSVFPVGTTTVTHTSTDNAGNTSEGTHTVTVSLVLDIDIKPGSDVNPLNPNGNGVVPVAILGSDVLDVTTINVSTVSINGSTPAHNGHIEDVNDDGVADLVVHLTPSDFGIDTATPGGTALTLTLTGEFNDETAFSGQDDVRINGNNENSKGKGGKGPK